MNNIRGKEKRILKMLFTKGGTGTKNTRLSIPISWCYHMKITEKDRNVIVIYDYDTKEIIIRKE
ncbi:MAG: hypothetical protein HFJ57_02295 [Clostridia bacterium]|nr:hypothetical protein [Clostridia bacterium]